MVNQIRNATRSRNVNPGIVNKQWSALQENYIKLKPLATKARVILNTNDAADIQTYSKFADKINKFITRNSPYTSLYDLISDVSPKELGAWGDIIRPDSEE